MFKRVWGDRKVVEIQELEIEISKLEIEQGGKYGHLSPKISKLLHKVQKLRNSL
jgi:hypothetical protein